MNEAKEQKLMPELSPVEKEAIFREALDESEELFDAFIEKIKEDPSSYDEDEFLLMEQSVENAALAAKEAGKQEEHDRLIEKHSEIMRWRFGKKWEN